MMVLMDLSSSSISGEVEVELLAEVVPVLLGLVVVDEASLLLPLCQLELSEELSLEELLVDVCLLASCLGYGQHYRRLFRDGLI